MNSFSNVCMGISINRISLDVNFAVDQICIAGDNYDAGYIMRKIIDRYTTRLA